MNSHYGSMSCSLSVPKESSTHPFVPVDKVLVNSLNPCKVREAAYWPPTDFVTVTRTHGSRFEVQNNMPAGKTTETPTDQVLCLPVVEHSTRGRWCRVNPQKSAGPVICLAGCSLSMLTCSLSLLACPSSNTNGRLTLCPFISLNEVDTY